MVFGVYGLNERKCIHYAWYIRGEKRINTIQIRERL